jgi:hypothetical protein
MSMNRIYDKSLLCPSGDLDMANASIFGIVVGTPEAPEVVYLDRVAPIPPELLTLDAPVKAREIFRISASCLGNNCQHFDNDKCRLIERIVDGLPSVVDLIPVCVIRSTCRWWNQEGKSACLRCPQIVRDNPMASEYLINLGEPPD